MEERQQAELIKQEYLKNETEATAAMHSASSRAPQKAKMLNADVRIQ